MAGVNAFEGMERTAMITGATGYVGYHLGRKLLGGGWEVHLLIRASSDTRRLDELPGTRFLHVHDGTTGGLVDIMRRVRPSFVFHLAAEVVVEHDPGDIEPLIRSNILFGTQLLEAARRAQVRYFINTGTFWQHDPARGGKPVNLYAAAKEAFETIVQFYADAFAVRAVTLNLFDVYGPCDTRDKLFRLLDAARRSGEWVRMTPGAQRLDLVYIDDVVEAFCHAARLLYSSPAGTLAPSYGITSGRHIALREVVRIYEQVTGQTLKIRWGGIPYRTRQVMTPWKAKTLPGWKAVIDLKTGIRRLCAEGQPGLGGPRNGRSRLDREPVVGTKVP